MGIVARGGWILERILHRLRILAFRSLFKQCGDGVVFGRGCDFSYSNIVLGDDVFIGGGATFNSEISMIRIGSKVMFGPNVTIMGGDHRTDVVGAYMYDVGEKLPENDQDVVIEDDVWVGSGAIILKGVRIGRGSVIGAGTVVVKDVPPYTVLVGVPPQRSWRRWDDETIRAHEAMLKGGAR